MINKGCCTPYGAIFEPSVGVFESYLVYIPGNANENINFSQTQELVIKNYMTLTYDKRNKIYKVKNG